MKVYVLTSGEYSDYRINYVTIDKEKAEKLGKIFSYWNIEEYDTDALPTEVFDGFHVYQVYFDRNGSLDYAQEIDPDYIYGSDLESAKSKCVYPINWFGDNYAVYVYAKDKEHAQKIAQDRLAEWKAEKERIV